MFSAICVLRDALWADVGKLTHSIPFYTRLLDLKWLSSITRALINNITYIPTALRLSIIQLYCLSQIFVYCRWESFCRLHCYNSRWRQV